MAIQPDRKIVVTGYSYAGCAVVRYNLDGTVDSTFGNYGRVVNNLNIGAVSNTLVLQSDGKILVAGNGGKGEQQSLLIRLTATGQLDNTFCHNGIDTEAFGCQLADYQTINIQPDGKIVLAGNAGKWYNAGPIAKYFIVTRYIDDDNIGTVNIKSTDNTSLIYPNPTSAFITLRYTVPEEGVMCMNLYDLEGNLIKTISPAQQYKPGCNTMKVDMSNLSSGTYIIVIQNAQGGKTQVKVVKE